MLLPLTGTPILQSYIDQWHAQSLSDHYAFSADTRIVLLQLMRFNAVARGRNKRTVKDSSLVNGTLDDLMLPVFDNADTLACTQHAFEVVAAIVHYGVLADSEHYRSFWKKKERFWVTDDGTPAVACTPADLQVLVCNAYLIWAIRKFQHHV